MIKTIPKLVVFGAGYVLGTRAGRERYEEIREIAQRFAQRLDERTADSTADADSLAR